MSNFSDLLECVSILPFARDGKLHDGILKKQFKFCRDKCDSRDCFSFSDKPFGHYLCSKGFSCYPLVLGSERIVLNGLINSDLNTEIRGDRRSQYRSNLLTDIEVTECVAKLRAAFRSYIEASNEGAKDSVAYFHDIRTSVGLVLSWCQKIISNSKGAKFEEKLASADINTHNLFGAINILQEQLELADIIANPSAITYGHKRPSSLTGFWYRMVKLFEPRADQRRVEIRFMAHGNDPSINAYNSFQFLPLVLLDNAIKYSFRDKTIFVEISVANGPLTISVSSFGKTVPAEFRETIFDKNVRGPNGIEENPEGMGMGLFIAKQIIQAHGYRIRYESPDPDVRIGNNKFVVEIPLDAVTFIV
jgi:signal transduction histidine kinase